MSATDIQAELEKTAALTHALRAEYEAGLSDEMGKLHNQFVAFIAGAQIPLPQVLLVLELLKRETLDQAYRDYLGSD